MSEITVTSEKVNVNGRDGYIATATDGVRYVQTHRQNTAASAENVAVRLFKDGVIDGVYSRPDGVQAEYADDGSADNWKPRIVPSTAGDNIKDFIIRFLLIGGLIAILALGVINFLISLVPVQ